MHNMGVFDEPQEFRGMRKLSQKSGKACWKLLPLWQILKSKGCDRFGWREVSHGIRACSKYWRNDLDSTSWTWWRNDSTQWSGNGSFLSFKKHWVKGLKMDVGARSFKEIQAEVEFPLGWEFHQRSTQWLDGLVIHRSASSWWNYNHWDWKLLRTLTPNCVVGTNRQKTAR